MIKLPKVINVMGIPYRVILKTEPWGGEKHFSKTGKMLVGDIGFIEKDICVCTKGPIEAHWATLFHEIIHAITSELRMKMSEDDTNRFAAILLDTIVRNKIIKEK